MLYSKEISRRWKAGEIQELAYFLNDEAGQGTFVEFVDAGIEYLYPIFVCGDEKLFRQHEQLLKNYAQDAMQKRLLK